KETDKKKAEQRIREEIARWKEKADAKEKELLELQEDTAQQMVAELGTNWYRFFLSYDPGPALRKVQCPVLALIGEKDLQVPSKANLEAITKALKEAGNKDFTVKELPDLNHLFQTCKTGSLTEYGAIEETMAPAVLEMMAEWIAA